MDLATVQQVLAQLYTKTVLRERFFENPQAVGKELGLSFDEIQQLAQLSSQQVNLFANSLKRKRLGEVRKLLPLTQKSLSKEFSQLFWRYAETDLPQGINKHWQDALNFCTFIEKVVLTEDLEQPWVLDVVRYEKVWLQTSDPTRRFHWCRFHHAIKPLVESLKQPTVTPVLLAKPTIGIWFRISRQAQLRHFIFSLPHGLGSKKNRGQNWIVPKLQIQRGVTTSVAILLALILSGCYLGSYENINPLAGILLIVIYAAAGFGIIQFLIGAVDSIKNSPPSRTKKQPSRTKKQPSLIKGSWDSGWGWGDSISHSSGGNSGGSSSDSGCGGSGCGSGGCGGGGCGGCGGGGCGGCGGCGE